MQADEAHERWAELAAGHVLSALDDADEAIYLEHAATCPTCHELERDLSAVLADLAHAPAQVAPPLSLKASIMRAVVEDDEKHVAPVVSIGDRRQVAAGNTDSVAAEGLQPRRAHRVPAWFAAAAAVIVVVGGLLSWRLAGGHQASVAARCAKVHCPTITLQAQGQQVGAVMVLNKVAYVQAQGLPATPSGRSYVLWRISGQGKAVPIAAVHTRPAQGPIKAGAMPVPITDVSQFALSVEPGDAVPVAPTDVIAEGTVA